MDFLGLEADSADIEETSISTGMEGVWTASKLKSVAYTHLFVEEHLELNLKKC